MMSFRELLESGANVSVTVKLDDLRTIFKEAAGTIRLTPDEPPTEEFLSRKEVLPFLKSTLPRFGAGRKPGTSNRARSAVANVTDERRSRRSAQAGEGAMMGAKKEKEPIPFLRVGTTILKRVRLPLSDERSIETLIPWNVETLRQDYGKDYIAKIPKYDGFCTVPSHTNYRREIHGFLNRYEPITTAPVEGEFPYVREFLAHIFGEQIELGYDYLQLLYVRPLQRLPILLLVSQERNTGKTTFLNFLKLIFEGNVTFNTNEDFRSQFNDDWTGKLLVCVDEVLLNRREDSERIKNLSTARSYKAEAKGRDRREVEFFGKFVLCSNNERNPVLIESGETRYWVRRVPPLASDNQHLLTAMRGELPGFLFFLLHRTLSSQQESRMWFTPRLLATEALRRIIHYNRSKAEAEMIALIRDIMDAQELEQYRFDVSDMVNMLEIRGIRSDHPSVRRILAENWRLLPAPPTYYTRYAITYNGEVIRQDSKTARVYTVTREVLNELLAVRL